jgi:energy-coupling factor transporter ATP-binding protein EcfA2
MDLEEYWNRDPRNLSGGEKQRVTIASAIAKDPDILVMIEPSFHLDPQGKKVVIDVINRLKRDGKTVILVETKLDRSSLAADRALVLESGGIVFDGEVETLLQNRKILERIGVCPPERGEIHARVP